MRQVGMVCCIIAGMVCALSMSATAQPAQNIIKAGDVVYVEVYRVAELTQSTQVDAQGNVTLPYIGPVLLAGLNESQAAARLSQSLKKILRNPRVTVRKSTLTNQPMISTHTDDMQMAIYPLQNADAESMYKVLNNMSSTGGTVSFDPHTNSILITDTPGSLKSMSAIIRQLDQMQSQMTQVRIEAKIAEVQIGAIQQMGVRWFAQGDHLSGGFIPPPSQTLGVNDMRGGLGPSSNENIASNGGGNSFSNTGREFVDDTFTQRLNIPVQVPLPGQTFLGYVNSGIDLGIMLDVLAQDDDAEILANPMTVTVNHQQALIKMVDQIPYTEFGTEITGASSFSTRFMDAGITLDVTPHVYQDDKGPYVKLELKPEVSFPVGATNGVPILSVRSTNTVANVRDRQTLVVGGIVNQNEQEVITKVPGLGDLPVIGRLFKHKEKTKDRTELVIFVTPTIFQNPEDITWDKMIDVASGAVEAADLDEDLEKKANE